MMIDPLQEPLIPISEIGRSSLPRPPSPACLWRWHSKGVNGIRLETVRVGGRRYTTKSAWKKFIQATTDAATDAKGGTRDEV